VGGRILITPEYCGKHLKNNTLLLREHPVRLSTSTKKEKTMTMLAIMIVATVLSGIATTLSFFVCMDASTSRKYIIQATLWFLFSFVAFILFGCYTMIYFIREIALHCP